MFIAEITAIMENGNLTNHFVEFNLNYSDDFMYQYSRQVLENFAGSKIDNRFTVYFKVSDEFGNVSKYNFNEGPRWNLNTIAVKLMNLLSKLQ